MPSDSPRNAVARQWELLKRLPSTPPGKPTSDLTNELADAGYRVTKRTVERDLEALENLFPITHGDVQPFNWHWIRGGAFGVMGLSTTDALSLQLLKQFLKPILPVTVVRQLQPVFELAEAKLAAQKQTNSLGSWSTKVAVVNAGLPVIPAPVDAVALQAIQESLLAGEQVEVDYMKSNAEAARARKLNPLGLVQCGSITYLVASTSRRDSPGVYALHRVQAARRLHLPAPAPEGFTLQGFIDGGGFQFGNVRRIRLKAWVSPMLATQLADTRLCENQKLESGDRGLVLTASLSYSWRLRWWLLSKSGDIEVLAPRELREEIGELLAGAAARYATNSAIQ